MMNRAEYATVWCENVATGHLCAGSPDMGIHQLELQRRPQLLKQL